MYYYLYSYNLQYTMKSVIYLQIYLYLINKYNI
jgi:hypothetical protein